MVPAEVQTEKRTTNAHFVCTSSGSSSHKTSRMSSDGRYETIELCRNGDAFFIDYSVDLLFSGPNIARFLS